MKTPTDIDRSAPVIVRVERRIEASLSVIWRLHTDVKSWPVWQNDISEASLAGKFEPGSTFHWRTAGFEDEIRSTIFVVERHVRTLWGGPAMGVEGVHQWAFQPNEGSVLVSTEESFAGGSVAEAADQLRLALETSLKRWLEFLEHASIS